MAIIWRILLNSILNERRGGGGGLRVGSDNGGSDPFGGILDRWEVKVILFVFAFLAKGEGLK